MSPLVNFLKGTGVDSSGRTIEAVLAMDDAALETTHDYIQWLFPLATMSENVWSSPILTREDETAIRESPEVQANMHRALKRMEAFYASTDHWLTYDELRYVLRGYVCL